MSAHGTKTRSGRAWQRSLACAGAIAAIFGAGASVATSSASACSTDAHCYGIVDWQVDGGGRGFLGDNVSIRSNCLTTTNTSSNFVTNETWVDFQHGKYWTEAGQAYGFPRGDKRYFYWADQRPGGGYHEHDGGSGPTLNQTYTFDIRNVGGNAWRVTSPYGGTSNDQPGPSNGLQAGLETTGNGTRSYGSVSSLTYYNLQNQLVTNWSAASGSASLTQNGGAFVRWVSHPSWAQFGFGSC